MSSTLSIPSLLQIYTTLKMELHPTQESKHVMALSVYMCVQTLCDCKKELLKVVLSVNLNTAVFLPGSLEA